MFISVQIQAQTVNPFKPQNMFLECRYLQNACLSKFVSCTLNTERKGEVVPIDATKLCCESGGIAPLILNFSTRWRWVARFTPQPLYPPQDYPVPIEKEVEWVPPAGLDVLQGENTYSLCSFSDDDSIVQPAVESLHSLRHPASPCRNRV